ncbi:MauE/DoxX family redox-associated membrane protein [Dactylosporangium sp. NPDC000244]|uniref:MauE/DoxX family redox-associated membrane protein n=1 Tax=Dactylosporangium sp. NPDC000244 TaxID=3154365 RepID=UPI003331249C
MAIGCGVLLVVIFAVSAAGKARSRAAFDEFAGSLTELRLVPRRRRRPVAAAVIAVEAGLVALFAVPGGARLAFPAAAALLTVFAVAIEITVRRGVRASCLCFGARSARPLDRVHVARNLVLAGVGALGLVAVTAPSPGDVHPAGAALAVAAAAVAAAVVLRLDDIAELFRPYPTLRQER